MTNIEGTATAVGKISTVRSHVETQLNVIANTTVLKHAKRIKVNDGATHWVILCRQKSVPGIQRISNSVTSPRGQLLLLLLYIHYVSHYFPELTTEDRFTFKRTFLLRCTIRNHYSVNVITYFNCNKLQSCLGTGKTDLSQA